MFPASGGGLPFVATHPTAILTDLKLSGFTKDGFLESVRMLLR